MKKQKKETELEHGRILENRFGNFLKQRNKIWKVLCSSYFQEFVSPHDTVIELGAGFCEFINNIHCKRKIAIDIAPEFKKYANKDVETVVCSVEKIPIKYFNSAQVVFMSNLLEHLPSKESVLQTFKVSHKLLKPNGRIIIMQPNIDLAHERYWDRIDHTIPLNGASVNEALMLSGFIPKVFLKRFLPLTVQSRYPKPSWAIQLYLRLPEILRPFAGQSLFQAVRKEEILTIH